MKSIEGLKEKFKEFMPASWSIDNRTAVYIITILITLYGLIKFISLPKEQFPDIVVPTISISTVYVGNSPMDIENLITRPIEKQIKGISGARVEKVESTSQQDFSLIVVEFDTDIKTDIARQKVKDAVDKAKADLPADLTVQPEIMEFSFSEIPIMFVNVSGDYDGIKLKEFADKMQDKFEELPEISRAEIVGAPEREIQVNVDPFKMQSARITFMDIENAIVRENLDIGGGQVEVGNMKRNLQVRGQFINVYDLQNIVVKGSQTNITVYLRDIAEIKDTIKEKESYARLDEKNVVTLNIIKRAGENLIAASGKIRNIVAEMKENEELPQNLRVEFTGDQSIATKTSFDELVNTIVIGFILVLLILMFFMGAANAFFVALSIPLSVFVAFMFLPVADFIVGTPVTLNFMVLFALLFALGIIVDDAIVVIENTHRIYNNGRVPVVKAAKMAAGEVFIPVLAGTLTTLAPFFPLLLWEGLIGKFMIYLPVMLILTLTASLIVAYIINPVFAVSFMRPEGKEYETPKKELFRKWWFRAFIIFGVSFNLFGWHAIGNFLILLSLLAILNVFVLKDITGWFRHTALPNLMERYEKLLHWSLHGKRPVWLLVALFVLFPVSAGLLILRGNDQTFFPDGDPNFIYVDLKLAVGTNVKYTDSVINVLEKKVFKVLEKEKPGEPGSIVESVIANVALGANDPGDISQGIQSNLGRIQVSFVEFGKRKGKSTSVYMDAFRKAIKEIPGAEVTVSKEDLGPPTEPPVNIEVAGDNFESVVKVASELKNYLDTNRVNGIEKLAMDIDLNNPEITISVDREKALIEGLSTGQIGMEIRTAVFGKEVSKLKDGEDEYNIRLRYNDLIRNNITNLLNLPITYLDVHTSVVKQIPLSTVAKIDYTNTTGAVKRKNMERTIQLQSNVLDPAMTAKINRELAIKIGHFKNQSTIPPGVTIKQTGQGEQEAETMSFLGNSLLISLLLIFLILVLQFNSMSKPFIILTEIFFSIIGVLLGYAITGMTLSTIMIGIGIVGLAGIVVKNGILLIEFTDELRSRGMRTREAAIRAGKIRIIPVLLTGLTTTLALLPLAVGMNIDFAGLFTHLKPNIYFGGESVIFWGPLCWTIIYGLIFAFFLTLVMIPSMYLISERLRRPMEKFYGTKYIALLGFSGPFFFIFVGLMYLVRKIQGKPVWLGTPKPAAAKA